MMGIVFSGESLLTDLEVYFEYMDKQDAAMTSLLAKNVRLLLESTTDAQRKKTRIKVNHRVKESLDELSGGTRDEKKESFADIFRAAGLVKEEGGPTRYYLREMAVEGFRGIRNEGEPLVLKFDHHSVNSVFAQNGMGKSSLFEALQYAIKGEVPRLNRMQASDKPDAYLLNLFHTSGEATILLTLLPDDDDMSEIKIEVKRSSDGERYVTSPTGHPDPDWILKSLNQDFTLLDYSTFTTFVEDTALKRGRSFSSLLGLSEYTNFRQGLSALKSTQNFRNDFSIPELEAEKNRLENTIQRNYSAFDTHYIQVTNEEAPEGTSIHNQTKHLINWLRDKNLLDASTDDIDFVDIDFQELKSAVMQLETNAEQDQLARLLVEKENLSEALPAPKTCDYENLNSLIKSRDKLLESTNGDHVHNLHTAAQHFLRVDTDWDLHICPLCGYRNEDPIDGIIRDTLSEFSQLVDATEYLKSSIFDSKLLDRLTLLEGKPSLCEGLETKHSDILRDSARDNLVTHEVLDASRRRLTLMEQRLAARVKELTDAITKLESKLPPSLVELAGQLSGAEQAQNSLKEVFAAEHAHRVTQNRLASYESWRSFISQAYDLFSGAEAELSTSTLRDLRSEYQKMFKAVMSAKEIMPELARHSAKENMEVELSNFYGKKDLSAQALLSESYRNALAISVFLAAAVKHMRASRFIVLDDATSSFDSGHQYLLLEQIRTNFQVPARSNGLQFILFSHDVALEKYFERLNQESGWQHQKLQGWPPLTPVTSTVQEPDRLKRDAEQFLTSGDTQQAAGLIRQYLESVLLQIIRKMKIPVPVDLAVNDHNKMVSGCIDAIKNAVELNRIAGRIVLTEDQIDGIKSHHLPSLVGNWTNHYGTSGVSMFTPPSLQGVLDTISDLRRSFQYDPEESGNWRFYRSLTKR